MTLPKAEYPLTDIYVFQLDKKIPFRPFLVKEEKLFENLKEQSRSESIETLSKCITNCSLGKVDGFTLPIFDLQNIWIQLTKISGIEMPEWLILCDECGEGNIVDIQIDNFETVYDERHKPVFPIRDNLVVTMRYPTAKELFEMTEGKEYAEFYDLAGLCIEEIEQDTAVWNDIPSEDKIEFVDSLTRQEFNIIKLFFETMPVVRNIIEFNCSHCEAENIEIMNGYFGFHNDRFGG